MGSKVLTPDSFCISKAIGSKALAGCSESGSLLIREGVESQSTGSLEQGS